MNIHSSKPLNKDSVIVSYLVNETVVNMPIQSKNQIKIYKQPAFKLIGCWQLKS